MNQPSNSSWFSLTFSFLLFGYLLKKPLSRTSLTGGTQPTSDPLSNSSWSSLPCSFLNWISFLLVRQGPRNPYARLPGITAVTSLNFRFGFHYSPPALRQPAFTFVFVFIALLLSNLLKAVRRPIANAPNSIAADWLESIALNGDVSRALYRWNPPSHFSHAAGDYLIG